MVTVLVVFFDPNIEFAEKERMVKNLCQQRGSEQPNSQDDIMLMLRDHSVLLEQPIRYSFSCPETVFAASCQSEIANRHKFPYSNMKTLLAGLDSAPPVWKQPEHSVDKSKQQ